MTANKRLSAHNVLESSRGLRNVKKNKEAILVCTWATNSQGGKYERRGKLVSFRQPDLMTQPCVTWKGEPRLRIRFNQMVCGPVFCLFVN